MLTNNGEQESIAKFGLDPPATIGALRNGQALQLYRALTHHWFHESAPQLILNMLFLASTGESLERAVGTTPFLLLILRITIAQSVILLAMFHAIPDRFIPPAITQHRHLNHLCFCNSDSLADVRA